MLKKETFEAPRNYEKYPGQPVRQKKDKVFVGDKAFKIIENYENAFNPLSFEQRYNEIFDKYDFIVGDWGFERLRLKGFYRDNRKGDDLENRQSGISDYLQEYCNYGATYFILERLDEPDDNVRKAPSMSRKPQVKVRIGRKKQRK